MMNERPSIYMLIPLAFLLLGWSLGGYIVDYHNAHDNWGVKTTSLMYSSSFVFIWAFFSKIGNKYKTLRAWATDTVTGVSLMLFSGGLILVTAINMYMLIPLPTWLHFSVSIMLSLVATGVFFYMAGNDNS